MPALPSRKRWKKQKKSSKSADPEKLREETKEVKDRCKVFFTLFFTRQLDLRRDHLSDERLIEVPIAFRKHS